MENPEGMTPIELDDRILNVWCLYMAIQTVKQAAHLMRHDYHHSECYSTYLNDSKKTLKEKKKKLKEAISEYFLKTASK